MSKILIVDGDPVTLNWLQVTLQREKYAVTAATRGQLALDEIAKSAPDLLVLDVVLPDMNGLDLLRRVRMDPTLRDLWIIILSVKDRPEDIASGMSAGADGYVPKRPGADGELISKIRELLARSKEPAPAPAAPALPTAKGKVFSFCSAKGGTGTTSVCINMAYAVTQLEPNAKVLLVDMVLPIGTVGQSVGYTSPNTVAHLTREVKGRLDQAVIEKYVSPILPWGLRVLLGTTTPQEANLLDVNQIAPLFDALRVYYDYILVDFGRTLSRISVPVIQTSDGIVIVVTPDVNTVKLSTKMLEYLESLGVPRQRFIVVNNRTVGRVWISKEETESEMKLKLAGTIPYESEYVTMATNAGVPFMAKFPDHAASLMFTDFARLLLERAKNKITLHAL